MIPFRLSYGLATDKGSIREINQDAAAARLFKWGEGDAGLFLVADGYGDHDAGKNAAQTAICTVLDEVIMQFTQPTGDGGLDYYSVLTEAFQKANRVIFEVQSKNSFGATTLTAALIIGEMLYIAHIGDSRAYYFSDDDVDQLTNDHTFLFFGIREGLMTWEDVISGRVHVNNRLLRILGEFEQLDVDNIAKRLYPQSTILLGTDGLHRPYLEYIQEPEVQTILRDDPQTACERLVALARQRGSIDDITALVVKIDAG